MAFLSLRDNALEQEAPKIFAAIRNMNSLQSLDVGGSNFTALRVNKKYSTTLSKAVNELTKLISADDTVRLLYMLLNS